MGLQYPPYTRGRKPIQIKLRLDDPSAISVLTTQAFAAWEGEDRTVFRARANAETDVTLEQTFEVLVNAVVIDTITIPSTGGASDFRGSEGTVDISLTQADRITIRHTAGNGSGTRYEITLKERN